MKDIFKKLGFEFKNPTLLKIAFTHKSFTNENKKELHNERLEFLGDAVLELVCTEFLFNKFPKMQEGEMTSIRSALVKKEPLAETARNLEIGKLIRLSRGENASGGREKDYILANTVEAIIGAIYIDKGIKDASKFIKNHILIRINEVLEQQLHIDAKSRFQELSQEKFRITPEYKILEEKGPDHERIFTAGVFLDEEFIAKGDGSSKQNAEVEAARNALIAKGWK